MPPRREQGRLSSLRIAPGKWPRMRLIHAPGFGTLLCDGSVADVARFPEGGA